MRCIRTRSFAAQLAGLIFVVAACVPVGGTSHPPATTVAPAPATVAAVASPRPTSTQRPSPVAAAFEVPEPVALEPLEVVEIRGGGWFQPTAGADWVIADEGQVVERRDRATGKVTRRIEPAARVYAHVYAFGSLWATAFDADRVYRYDLATGELAATIEVGRGPDGILAAAGSIWVADHFGGAVERIDPTTDDVVATIVVGKPGRGGPAGMVEDGGRVWVSVPIPGRVTAIDVVTNAVVAEVDVPMYPCGVAIGHDTIWLDQCSDTAPTIATLAVDGASPVVHELPELAFLAGRIADRDWLLYDGLLVAVDADPFKPTDARSINEPIESVLRDGDAFWIRAGERWARVPETAFERASN